jgi:hypothetical protein
MRYDWRVITLCGLIVCAPVTRAAAQHDEHPMNAGGAPAAGQRAGMEQAAVAGDIARLRAATAAFKNLDAAVAAGYQRTQERCISHPTLGAMGYHHQNDKLLDGRLEVERPEILVYRRAPNGEYALTGVEYVVPYSATPPESAPPVIMGQPLKRFDAAKIWYLHAWSWLENPTGTFADWNPSVSCN